MDPVHALLKRPGFLVGRAGGLKAQQGGYDLKVVLDPVVNLLEQRLELGIGGGELSRVPPPAVPASASSGGRIGLPDRHGGERPERHAGGAGDHPVDPDLRNPGAGDVLVRDGDADIEGQALDLAEGVDRACPIGDMASVVMPAAEPAGSGRSGSGSGWPDATRVRMEPSAAAQGDDRVEPQVQRSVEGCEVFQVDRQRDDAARSRPRPTGGGSAGRWACW